MRGGYLKNTTSFMSDRLQLVPLKKEDANDVYELLSSREHTRYLKIPTTDDFSLVQTMTRDMAETEGNCIWLLLTKEDKSFVGMCGFLNDGEYPNFIYSVTESFKGKGYATEASHVALVEGVKLLRVAKVEMHIHSQNESSLKIAAKLGFSEVSQYSDIYPQDAKPSKICVFQKTFTQQ